MKTLDLIRFLCQNQFRYIFFYESDGEIELDALEVINHLASIDPSWYDDIQWELKREGKFTLHIHRIKNN